MDYNAGRIHGMNQSDSIHAIVRARNDREVDNAITSWESYSAQLKSQLEQTQRMLAESEARTVANEAGWIGDAAVAIKYREALAVENPNHPFLVKGSLKAIKVSAAAASAMKNGYTYNPDTGGVRRRG